MLQLATLLLSLPIAGPGVADFEVTQALLDDAVRKARPAVERALGYPIPEGFGGIRVATIEEVEATLARENVPIMLAQLGDAEQAKREARTFAAGTAPALLAKYAFEERAILVSEEALRRSAKVLGMPELLDESLVRALVVHELVHAADVPHHGFAERCVEVASGDRVATLNAVLEGHAQHVARAACAELGLTEALDLYSRAIVAEPPSAVADGAALRLLYRARREAASASYVAGEAFVAAVMKDRGREGIAEAFRAPPQDMVVVHRPQWYLDPSSRPAILFDLEAAGDVFDAAYDRPGWAGRRASVNESELRLAFEPLGAERSAEIIAGFRGGRNAFQALGQEAMHYVLTIEWASEEAAELAYTSSLELTRLRDEQMKEGFLRVASAEYVEAELGAGGPVATLAIKEMKTPFQSIQVEAIFLRSGALTFEVLRSNEVGDREEFLALTGKIVRAARAPAPTDAEPEAPKKEEPEDDGTSGEQGG